MIPSSTGAAKALKLVIPEMAGKLDGFAIRVPTPNVSVVDLTFISEKPITSRHQRRPQGRQRRPAEGHPRLHRQELVSSDFKGNPLSSIVDAPLTKVVGNSVKVISWYDNEWGYSNRVIRVDFNVPLTEDGTAITDDTRIRATLPTIEYAIRHNAKVILASHLGRPKGKPNPKYSLRPVVDRLRELLDHEVGSTST
jgi:hypothetical protein